MFIPSQNQTNFVVVKSPVKIRINLCPNIFCANKICPNIFFTCPIMTNLVGKYCVIKLLKLGHWANCSWM